MVGRNCRAPQKDVALIAKHFVFWGLDQLLP